MRDECASAWFHVLRAQKCFSTGCELDGVVEHNPAAGYSTQTITMQDPIRSDVTLEFNIPDLTNMAAVTWQTYRFPEQGKHLLNRTEEGTNVQYLNENFVKKYFSGVLKVTVLSMDGPVLNGSGVRINSNECNQTCADQQHGPFVPF